MTERILSYLKGHNCSSLDSTKGDYLRTMRGSMGPIGSSVLKIALDGHDPTRFTYSLGSIRRVHGPLHHSACRRQQTPIQLVCTLRWWKSMNDLCGKTRFGSLLVVLSARLDHHQTVKGKITKPFSYVESQSHPISLNRDRVKNESLDFSASLFSPLGL